MRFPVTDPPDGSVNLRTTGVGFHKDFVSLIVEHAGSSMAVVYGRQGTDTDQDEAASVLWPSLQRDFLLSMAVEGLYRPLWSDAILDELRRHEALKLLDRDTDPGQAAAAAAHLVAQTRSNFDDALVVGWEPLEGTYGLPDLNDEHVVAAGVVGGAGSS